MKKEMGLSEAFKAYKREYLARFITQQEQKLIQSPLGRALLGEERITEIQEEYEFYEKLREIEIDL